MCAFVVLDPRNLGHLQLLYNNSIKLLEEKRKAIEII